jgi:excisionase family DNA binding protein
MTSFNPGVPRRQHSLPADRLFGKPALARFLGLSISGLSRILESGRGPTSIRVGRLVRFHSDDVEAWLDRQREQRTQRDDSAA